MKLPFHFDVIVIGGGPAGIPAAIQAARAGARTLLVEKSGILGGTTVLNGVNFPGLFHAWGRQIIAGIGWELVTDAVRESGGDLPDFKHFRGIGHSKLQVLVDKAIYAAIADQHVLRSGVVLLFHTMPAQVIANASGWRVTLCSKEGLHDHTCDVLVDCTGDANAVALAGLPLHRNARLQPGTLIMQISGYDIATLDLEHIEAAYLSAVARDDMLRSDFHATHHPVTTFLRGRGNNAMQVANIDAATSLSKTNAEIRAREAMLRIIRFLRSQPGLQALKVDYMATECGIRETVTIDGVTRISSDDYLSGRVWPDSLCHSFYPIDIHYPDGVGIDIRPLKEGIVPTIPRGAMLPKGCRNLLVAGRSVCGDQEANSAFRVQASSMAMGQAAGAMAALSSASKQDVADLPIKEIHSLLQKHSAIVPEVRSERFTQVVND